MDGLFSPLQIASAGTPAKAPQKTGQQPETREERKLARMRNTGGTPNSKPGSTHSTPNGNPGPKLTPTTHLPTSQLVASGSSQAQAFGSDRQQAEKPVAWRSSGSRTSGSDSKPQHVSIVNPKRLVTSPPQPAPPAPEPNTQLAATEEELQERQSSNGKLRSLDPKKAEVLDNSTTSAKEKDTVTKKAGGRPRPSEFVEVAANPVDPSHTLHKGLQQAQAAASQSTFQPNSAPAKVKNRSKGKASPRPSPTPPIQSLDEVHPSRETTREANAEVTLAPDPDPTPPPLPHDQLKQLKRTSPGTAAQEESEREKVAMKRQKGRRGKAIRKLVEPEEQGVVAEEKEVVDGVPEEEEAVPAKVRKGRKGKAKVVQAEVEPEEPQEEEVAEEAGEAEEIVVKRPKGKKGKAARKVVEPEIEADEEEGEAVEGEDVAEEFVEEAAVAGKRQKGKKGKSKAVEPEVEQDEPHEEEEVEEVVVEEEPVTKRSKGQKAIARRKAVEPEEVPEEDEEEGEEAAQEEEVSPPPAKKKAGRKSKDKRDGKRKLPTVAEPEEEEAAPVVPKKRRAVAPPSDEEEGEVESPPTKSKSKSKPTMKRRRPSPASEEDGNGDEDDEDGDNKPRKKKCHFQVDRLLFPSSSVPKLPVAAGNEDDEAAISTSLLKKLRKRASNILTPLDVTWHAIRLTIDQLVTVPNHAQPLTPTDQAILTRILSHLRSRVLDLSDLSIAQSMLSRRLYLAKRDTKRLQGELMDLRAERREVAVEMEIEERGWREGKKEREGKRELDQWVRGVEGFKDEWSGEPEAGAGKRAGGVEEDPSALEAVLVALAGGLGGEETGMLEGLRSLRGLVKSG